MNAPNIQFDHLSHSDIAAATAHEAWLVQAYGRGGKQIPPEGYLWNQTIFRSGRGFGKTRALVEWQWWECWRAPGIIGHAVAPTKDDIRKVLMLGPAGFRACIPAECLAGESWDQAYDASHNEVLFKNGSIIRSFSAADQGARLRGPACSCAVGDELRQWDKPVGNLEFVHSNLMLGVRERYPDGTPARAVFATTPKAIPYLRNLYRRSDVHLVTGSTYENLANLSASFSNTILALEGTQISKAEIYGLDTDAEEGGIFKRSWFRLWPAGRKLPEFEFILMSMDTAFEDEHYDAKKQTSDFSACIILGVFNTKQVFTEAELKRMGVKSKYAAVLCDLWNLRLSFPELLEKARESYRTKWGSTGTGGSAGLAGGRKPDIVLIENKASGISLRQTLNTYGVPTWPFNPYSESKTMRAHAASPYVLQGHIFVPESKLPERKGLPRDWIEPMLEQVCAFAGEGSVEHDDLVDALVQAILYLSARGLFLVEPMGRTMPDPDEEDERKLREATEIAERQKHRLVTNPYD
jgi:predicted phage terminase large subunit-like protein